MYIFDTNSRIEKVAEGIRFYQPDIFCCKYALGGDQVIDVELDYRSPGFGLVVAEKTGDSIFDSRMSYLFKLGDGDYRVYQKRGSVQEEIRTESADLSPSDDAPPTKLRFQLRDGKISCYKITDNESRPQYLLGSCTLPFRLSEYNIAFYSNTGNILRNIKVLGNVPEHWNLNAANADGGRIRLMRDAFIFENCLHDAEMEQDRIELKKGHYYLIYQHEPVDGQYDIEAYIFPSVNTVDGDLGMEDDRKNLLKDGSFILEKDMTVDLKFKGTSGRISNISLADSADAVFVETNSTSKKKDGSYLDVNTASISKITWEATIHHVPKQLDGTVAVPYSLFETKENACDLNSAHVQLGDRYYYEYDVATGKLLIHSMVTTTSSRLFFNLTDADGHMVRLLRNATASLFSLLLIKNDGTSVDIVSQQTSKKYVPAAINGPVVVTDENGSILDISSSYREIITPSKAYVCYSREMDIRLPPALPKNVAEIKVYGVADGVKVNTRGKTMSEIASDYALIPEDQYSRTSESITITNDLKNRYAHFIVEYLSVDNFMYEVTNEERETFDGSSDILALAKMPIEQNAHVVVYGVKNSSYINEEMIRRIPNAGMINSIDYYAESYDVLTSKLYTIDFGNATIAIDRGLHNKYQQYIVDYLKADSCAINYRESLGQYEVDISSTGNRLSVHYDEAPDGGTPALLATAIKPDRDKYVVLREKV